MVLKRAPLARPLPGGVVVFASLFVVFHFFAINMYILAAPSGPWLVPGFGPSPALGPPFASELSKATTEYYLQPLRMAGNYHYSSNHVDMPSIVFEARLRDERGDVFKTLQFPSPKDNFWLRHRHAILAEGLGGDVPIPLPRGEMIPAQGQATQTLKLWYPADPQEKKLAIRETEQHLVKDLFKDPGMQLARPREWTLLLARSYARYLARAYGAASVQIIRNSRDPVMPALLFGETVPPGTFETLVSQFEDYRRDN
jgi:hypothetical protein